MSGGDWTCLFSRNTPWSDLQRIIEAESRAALHVWLATLLDDADLSDRQRAQAWALGAPTIRAQYRTAMETAWMALQRPAPTSGMVVQ